MNNTFISRKFTDITVSLVLMLFQTFILHSKLRGNIKATIPVIIAFVSIINFDSRYTRNMKYGNTNLI